MSESMTTKDQVSSRRLLSASPSRDNREQPKLLGTPSDVVSEDASLSALSQHIKRYESQTKGKCLEA
jgi:hypothetical protein